MARIDRKQISIKWKMFFILMLFVAVIGLTIWVFQIQMLNFFYQNAKFDELNDIFKKAVEQAVNDRLKEPTPTTKTGGVQNAIKEIPPLI